MESIYLNRYQMLVSTQNYLDSNNNTWSAIPIMNTFKSLLDELIQATKEQLTTSGNTTKGLTMDKSVLKEQISIKVSVLSGALSAFAMVTDNQELNQNAYLTKTEVLRLRDIELPDRLGGLLALLSTHLPALADYGVTEPQLNDLSTSLDDFRDMIGQPRLKGTTANLAKIAMSQLVDETATLLKDKMDKVMLQYQWSNPSFYEGYKRARTIVD
ncbi:MAG: hypothetical protein OCD76_01115 [Reichenbachiella sp.]